MLREKFQCSRRHVFELGGRSATASPQLRQCSFVEIIGGNVVVSDCARWTVVSGIQHTHFVAERLRGHAKHPAELPTAQQPEPRTRRNRVHQPLQRQGHVARFFVLRGAILRKRRRKLAVLRRKHLEREQRCIGGACFADRERRNRYSSGHLHD